MSVTNSNSVPANAQPQNGTVSASNQTPIYVYVVVETAIDNELDDYVIIAVCATRQRARERVQEAKREHAGNFIDEDDFEDDVGEVDDFDFSAYVDFVRDDADGWIYGSNGQFYECKIERLTLEDAIEVLRHS